MANYIKTDRFGRPYQVIGCRPNKNDFPVGVVTLGGKRYKLEPSEAQKEGYMYWIKVTKLDAKKKHSGM